jgi:hypothetical protein
MKTLNYILVIAFISIILACNQNVSVSNENTRQKQIQDSITRIKNDSIKKAEAEKKAYENRPWKMEIFVDKFGDPTGDKYISTFTIGSFLNSAIAKEDLYVKP